MEPQSTSHVLSDDGGEYGIRYQQYDNKNNEPEEIALEYENSPNHLLPKHSPSEKDPEDSDISLSTKIPRRVKVYLLQGEDWLDNGTGYCSGEVLTGPDNKPYFIVRNELNPEEIILKSFLEGAIQYQRQQETLIVWTDLSGKDLALSFQETEGCAELCEFIIKVQQQNYCPDISLYYVIPNTGINESNTLQNGTTNDITELITGPINYPEDPTVDNLEIIIDAINQGSNSQYARTNILKFIIKEEYFMKLINVFEQLEKSHNLKNLFTLAEIIKTLILYNEPCLIGDFLSTEEKIMGMVGILEYDSEYPKFKACHRDFLKDKSKFKSVIDIPNVKSEAGEDSETKTDSNLNIFKKDFFLNFLKNVALARFLDDQTYNTLSSLIYFNQVEIINFLKDSKKNENFCEKLFNLYNNDDVNASKVTSSVNDNDSKSNDDDDDDVTTDLSKNVPPALETKRDGVRMLHQYVLITKSLQSYQKSEFFSVLVNTGLFKMIGFALKDDDTDIRVLGTELIVVIIDQDVSLVNSVDSETPSDSLEQPSVTKPESGEEDDKTTETKGLKLKLSDDMTLTLILSKLLLEDKNPGLKIQAFEALRILLDSSIASNIALPDNLKRENGKKSDFELEWLKNEANGDEETSHSMSEDYNHINTHNYFKAFYNQVASTIFHNLIELARDQPASEQEQLMQAIKNDQVLYQHLCELISFCCKEHDMQISRPFFLENNILLGIGKLITSEVKLVLKLSAIRCLKNIVSLNDGLYTRYLIDHDILKYYLEFFEIVLDQNNLANSTCLDFLEIIIKNCDKSMNHGKRQNYKLLATYIYENSQDLCHRISYVSTGKDLVNLVENKFYESNGYTTKQMSICNDSTFESDDDELLNGSHDVSTPIRSDSEDEEKEPKTVNLFESVEKDLEVGSGENGHGEDSEKPENGDLISEESQEPSQNSEESQSQEPNQNSEESHDPNQNSESQDSKSKNQSPNQAGDLPSSKRRNHSENSPASKKMAVAKPE